MKKCWPRLVASKQQRNESLTRYPSVHIWEYWYNYYHYRPQVLLLPRGFPINRHALMKQHKRFSVVGFMDRWQFGSYLGKVWLIDFFLFDNLKPLAKGLSIRYGSALHFHVKLCRVCLLQFIPYTHSTDRGSNHTPGTEPARFIRVIIVREGCCEL